MMTGITDHDDRLIRAAERIADALEQLVALSTSAGPKPRLVVARSRTDGSRSQPVRLKADGMLLARVQNLGEADTMLSRPTVQLGAITMQGGIVDAESVPQPSANVPASKDGAGVLLQFMLDRSAQNLFHDERMVILLPHSPGRFPGVTVLEVQLEPTGVAAGTPSWRPTGVRELPQDHGPT